MLRRLSSLIGQTGCRSFAKVHPWVFLPSLLQIREIMLRTVQRSAPALAPRPFRDGLPRSDLQRCVTSNSHVSSPTSLARNGPPWDFERDTCTWPTSPPNHGGS